ncbi:MAG: protein kinase [Fuerstiella sp.]
MTNNKDGHDNPESDRPRNLVNGIPINPFPEPDMGVAGDPISSPLSEKRARRKNQDNAAEKADFLPASALPESDIDDVSATEPSEAEPADSSQQQPIHKKETWVPSEDKDSGKSDSTNEDTAVPEDSDFKKTWVPTTTPTRTGLEVDGEDDDGVHDFEKTWVPPETSQSAFAEAEDMADVGSGTDGSADFEKTWVPSDTPTVNGINLDDTVVPDEIPTGDGDLKKTWVPSKTPTHHDFSFDAAAGDGSADGIPDNDPNKTFVPSKTPTFDGMSSGNQPENSTDEEEDVFAKTNVIQGRPPAPDFTATQVIPTAGHDGRSTDDSEDLFAKTVVQPDPNSQKSGSDTFGTVVANVATGFEKTEVFSRTMGMRGLSEDEYEEWQKEVSEKSASDTSIEEPPSDEDDGSLMARKTQIWSKQSAHGLNQTLTIRSRPVAGGDQFRDSGGADKPDYEIIGKLAEGGMGAIFIAKQTSLDRELAIKTLKPMKDRERQAYTAQGRISQVEHQRREMFLSEALVTANLVHPHIIPIHDLCQTNDGFPFYSMKRVHGTPWNERIREMSLEENLEVLHKVCDAMAYAHHNGVVNRDLKPENIMLGEFGEVLVLDWGLAVPATAADKKRFASPAAAFGAGTPAYMSPELWTGPPEAIGRWSDIYLLGAILFEIITGESPHSFPEPEEDAGNSGLWVIIDKVVRQNAIRPTSHKGELMDIARKAMSASRKDRHQSVLGFQDAVKKFQKHEESRRVSERAGESLQHAKSDGLKRGYHDYQTAAALFEQAFVAWPENDAAVEGLRETRLAYAGLAHTKGDYDLGLQIAEQESGPEFVELTGKLSRSRRLRNGLKSATVIAVCLIAVVGAISFVQAIQISKQNNEITKQNNEITSLYGDKETLEQDKLTLEEDKNRIVEEKTALLGEKTQLLSEQSSLKEEKLRLTSERDTLVATKQELSMEKDKLLAEKDVLKSEKENLQTEVAKVETEKAAIQLEVAGLTEQKARAKVELKNAFIASLIRSADYSGALQRVEELLNSDTALADLPADERQERILELQARKQQLLKRTRVTEAPVQTQVISPSGRTIVWGDSNGLLTAWHLNEGSEELPAKPLDTLNVDAAVAQVLVSENEELIVAAADKSLYLWNVASHKHDILKGHEAAVSTIALNGNLLLSADTSGVIKAWNIDTQLPLWSIRSSSSIRSLALMPKAGVFLYAGSRGGESSDVLAYQLPPDDAPTERPQRLGQLRFPRDRNDPPNRICVAPNEQILLISNSRNGDLMALPVRPADNMTSGDRFPFVHAADLQAEGFSGWVASEHQRPINDIRFSADGLSVVTASDDRTIGIWHVQGSTLASSTDEILTFQQRMLGHGAKVNAAGFLDAKGKTVLSASADHFCRFWDVRTYAKERQDIESAFQNEDNLPASNTNAAATYRSPYILTGHKVAAQSSVTSQPSDSADQIVVNADSAVQRGALNAIAISKDGSRIVTGASDGTAVIWNAKDGSPISGGSSRTHFVVESASFEEGHDFNVARLKFLPPDGRVLMTTGFDGNLCLWNADPTKAGAGAQEVRLPGLGLVNAISASPDGTFLAASMAASEVEGKGVTKIWKTDEILHNTDPQTYSTLQGFHDSEVSTVSFSQNGMTIATGGRDGRVAVWTLADGTFLAGGQMHAKNTIVSHLEWLPNGDLISAGFDGRLQRLGLDDSGTRLSVVSRFQHDNIPVERLSFSPDKLQFVTISVRTDKATRATTQELQLWSLNATNPQRRIHPAVVAGKLPSRISAISWSDDGNRLAAVVDGKLQIFRTADWKITKVLNAPGLGISDAVFAPEQAAQVASTDGTDGTSKSVAGPASADQPGIVATFDGTAAHLWNLNDNAHLADFRPLYAVHSTALSPNAEHPLLLTGDRAIRIFDAAEDSERFGQTIFKISDPHRGVVTSLCFAPNSHANRFVSCGADGSALLWNWDAALNQATIESCLKAVGPDRAGFDIAQPHGERVAIVQASWSPDEKLVLLVNRAGQFSIIDLANPETPLVEFQLKSTEPIRLETGCFSSDGRFVALAGQLSEGGSSAGWVYDLSDMSAPQLHATITGHEAGGIRSLAFLPDSSYLLTGGADGAAIIWNWQPQRVGESGLAAYEAFQLLANGKAIAHQAPVTSLVVSESGTIASASEDGTAIIWRNPFQ